MTHPGAKCSRGRPVRAAPPGPMKSIGLLLAAAFAATGVHAQGANEDSLRKALADTPVNAFRHIGNHLVCKQDTPAQNYLACLRIGPMRVGDSYGPVRDRVPAPVKEVALDGGVIAAVHPIIIAPEARAYWIIGHRDGRIVSVQLTGNFPRPDLAFSTIQLGDSEEKVLAVLGPRASIREVREIGGLLWDYRPFPISIEFVNGQVYSIRVAEPAP